MAMSSKYAIGVPTPIKGLEDAFFVRRKAGTNGVQIVSIKTSSGADYRVDNLKTRIWVYPRGDYSQKASLTDLTDGNDLLRTVRALEAGVKKLRLSGKFKSVIQESTKHKALFNINTKLSSSFSHFDTDKVLSDLPESTAVIGKVLLNPVVYCNSKGNGLSLTLLCSQEIPSEKENDAPKPIVECPW